MSDADVIDEVLDLAGVQPWTEDNLNKTLESAGWCFSGVTSRVGEYDEGIVVWELTFELWELDLDDEDQSDYEQLEALAKPRMDALRELFEQRASGWEPGAITNAHLDEWEPFGYSRGWHRGERSVEIGYMIHDNGLPLMVQLRVY